MSKNSSSTCLSGDDVSLNESFITKINLSANPLFEPDKDENNTICHIEATFIKKSKTRFLVVLVVSSGTEDETLEDETLEDETLEDDMPYSYLIEAFASVELKAERSPKTEKEDHKYICAFGLQVLVGTIREQLLTLSGRGPWSRHPVKLDIWNLNEVIKNAKFLDLTEDN